AGKLAPGVSAIKEELTGRDFKGEKLSDKSIGKRIEENVAPLVLQDLIEGYQQEGIKGVVKTAPTIFGARVANYPDKAKAAFLDIPPDVRAEEKAAGLTRPFLQPKKAQSPTEKDETPERFASRVARDNQLHATYEKQLTDSGVFQSATAEEKKAALEYVKREISRQSGARRLTTYLLTPGAVFSAVRESARRKQREAA